MRTAPAQPKPNQGFKINELTEESQQDYYDPIYYDYDYTPHMTTNYDYDYTTMNTNDDYVHTEQNQENQPLNLEHGSIPFMTNEENNSNDEQNFCLSTIPTRPR